MGDAALGLVKQFDGRIDKSRFAELLQEITWVLVRVRSSDENWRRFVGIKHHHVTKPHDSEHPREIVRVIGPEHDDVAIIVVVRFAPCIATAGVQSPNRFGFDDTPKEAVMIFQHCGAIVEHGIYLHKESM
jgi:hypothetical protein